jgi:hypothetical protein
MRELGGLVRMVNRSDGAVDLVLVNGNVAFEAGALAPHLGQRGGFGQFLPAGAKVEPGPVPASVPRAA